MECSKQIIVKIRTEKKTVLKFELQMTYDLNGYMAHGRSHG